MTEPHKLHEVANVSTVDAARDMVRGLMYTDAGVVCPVCDRLAKVYRRKINAGMLKPLLRLYALCPLARDTDGYVKIGVGGAFRTAGGDYAKLTLWGMIEPLPNAERADGSTRVGFWRITEWGRRFVEGKAAAPKYMYEYHGKPVTVDAGRPEKMVTVYDLDPTFDFGEMMATSRAVTAAP